MKKAIVSLAIGNANLYNVGLQSALDYSKRVDADFHVITEQIINYKHLFFEKLQLLSLFDQGYDRVLYLDGDVIVTPHAKDIFKEYPDETKFYAYDENSHPDNPCMDRDSDVEALPKDFEWIKNSQGKYRYFNGGVMLFSKQHRFCFSGIQHVPDVPEMWIYGDQTVLNYLIAKGGVEWNTIDYSFNRMDLGKEDPQKKRFEANIIHYAGACLYREEANETKFNQMIKDWEYLKNDS